MQRKIRFRAWNPSKKCWVSYPKWDEAQEANGNSYSTILELTDLNNHCIWSQLTGLQDLNGKDIYEGDLLYFSNTEKLKMVIFHNGGFCLQNYESEPTHLTNLFDLLWLCGEEFKPIIIGNIFENPELIKNNNLN